MGLFKLEARYNAIADISESIVCWGMNGLLNKLSFSTLHKICLELRLVSNDTENQKSYLVNRFMFRTFEFAM